MLAACRFFACLSFLCLASGCAMCGNCDDYSYPTYGGAWERLDPFHGRVGSVFTPEAGMRVLGEAPGTTDAVPPTETQPQELLPPTDSEGMDNRVEDGVGSGAGDGVGSGVEPLENAPVPPAELDHGHTNDTSVLIGPIRSKR